LLDVAVVPTASGHAVVGFIQANLIAREEDRAHTANRVVRIDLIVVTEALRRRGIGRKLIARVKTWAESMRADSVILDSYAFNIVAARLYEKSGFQVLKKTYMQTIS
jgi:GNAT superfamily N-acetyltransferase